MTNLIERVKSFLIEYKLEDKTIIVGFSGGYDSMCLLDILSKIRQDEKFYELNVIAAHFNHNWRGEESMREQEVCRLFSASRGFEFYTETAPSDLKKTENDARQARYEFFEDAFDNYDADAVFTAHNKDDNAETVLYRTIKGTGLIGLQGISEKRGFYYRPLLKTSRAEIVEYCEYHNLSPNNDSSNLDTMYNRNYLRLNVIPALEKINPSVKESLNTLAEVASSENSLIEEYLAMFRDKVFNNYDINSSEYKVLSKPVKMRFLYEFLQKFNLDYDYKRIKEIYDFIEANIGKRNGTTHSLTASMWLYVDEKIIETIPHKTIQEPKSQIAEVLVDTEGEYNFGDTKFVIKPYVEKDVFIFPESTARFAYIDLSDVKMPLYIRNRKDGDVINPFGMTGSMKLKKYLNSKGISRHKRDELILLANEDEVLWVVGVGLSNKIGVTKVPTHVIEVI